MGSPRFGKPLAEIMENTKIPRMQRLAYAVMACSTDGRNGFCKLSVTSLAARLGIARQNTAGYVKGLEKRGIITRLTKDTQAAQWRVWIGGLAFDNLSRQHDKMNGNLSRTHDENLSRQSDTYRIIQKPGSEFESHPPARVITEEQEKALIKAQEELEKKRANLGISQKA